MASLGCGDDQPFDDPAYLFEPKFDGFRGVLHLGPGECCFRSKRGNVLKQFEQLCYWVREELRVKEAILDGEVVALDPEGRQDFRRLLARRGNLHYAAFDVLWLNGKDLRGLSLTRRKRALERVIPATSTVLSRVFAVEGCGRDLFAAAERLDLEGIVAKRKADSYLRTPAPRPSKRPGHACRGSTRPKSSGMRSARNCSRSLRRLRGRRSRIWSRLDGWSC